MDNKFDDEIIDLEDEELNDDTIESVEQIDDSKQVSPNTPNITKRGNNKSSDLFNGYNIANSDKSTPQRLQSIGKNNRSFPPLGGSSFSNQDNNEEKEDGLKEKVQDKVVAKTLTVATDGAINGKTAEKIAEMARKSGVLDKINPIKRYKWYLIGGCSLFVIILLAFLVVIASSDDTDMNSKTSTPYIDNQISDQELTKQLKYYGYCTDDELCKKSGVYKFFEKLKELHGSYAEECGINTNFGEKCGVNINTALIIETMNYYSNELIPYDSKNTGTTEEDLSKEENKSIFARIVNYFKSQKRINTMLDDAENLANAQVEYVEETCRMSENSKTKTTLKYNHISFDKYISYLAYGESSTHPNYKGEAVKIENDICVGPVDDFISTDYEKTNQGYKTDEHGNITSIAGTGRGVEIVNYALQFVGNPYVWGGNSLTNGIDCSGFTKAIYGHFGIELPRKSSEQIKAAGGTVIARSLSDINKAQAGDLLVWDGHVAIYMGDGKMVHAQSKKTGIVVSGVSSGHQFLGIVRFGG